jgi:hypothetical protein
MDWRLTLSLQGSHRPPSSQIQYEIHFMFHLSRLPSKLRHFLLGFDVRQQCADSDAG